MLRNIFVTGTNDQMVLQMGNHKMLEETHSFYHAVSHHHNSSTHVSHFSAFSAPLVCSYAKSYLSKISLVCVCLKVPSIISFSSLDKEKSIEKSFHTEWYFTIDLVRQSLLLFSQINKDESTTKDKMFISLPHLNTYKLNLAELVYYRSLCAALKTMMKHYQTNHKISLVFYDPDVPLTQTSQDILTLLSHVGTKEKHKKMFFLGRHSTHCKTKIKNFFRG